MSESPEGCHSHPFPKSIVLLVTICLVGLLAGVVLAAVQVHRTNARLAALEEYVQGRGEFRDREADRLEERIRRGLCDLLDQLPAYPDLDRPRQKYGCGPGLDPAQVP